MIGLKTEISSSSSSFVLHKICEDTRFQWPVFSRINTESTILSLYLRIRVSENPYSLIFYAVLYKVRQRMSLDLVVVSVQNMFYENRTSICTFAVIEQKKLLKSFASIHRSIITFSFMLTIFGDCCMMLWCCFLIHLL